MQCEEAGGEINKEKDDDECDDDNDDDGYGGLAWG